MKSMVHHCAVAANGCKKTACSACKRGFDKPTNNEKTKFDEKGFPVYKRHEGDERIVAHNIRMLLDWDGGHMNVEFSGSAKSVMYLYDYLFKGTTNRSRDT
jgi:hypothetical protein